jgi:hypothetical protein
LPPPRPSCTTLALPRWPSSQLCQQQALLLQDFAYNDRFAWTLPSNLSRSDAIEAIQEELAAQQNPANGSAQNPNRLPSDLIKQLGPGYNGTLPVRYINSAWLCQQPSAACAREANLTAQKACLLQGYTRINPDVIGAAAPSRNYGVQVVLPAVLGAVGEWGAGRVVMSGGFRRWKGASGVAVDWEYW